MFEYQVLHSEGMVSIDDLNSLGKDRWELVQILKFEKGFVESVAEPSGYFYFFKKFRETPANLLVDTSYIKSKMDEARNNVHNV